jgi:hypothetical protein
MHVLLQMTFVQALSGHGGWPMSVWLTPDLEPFTGGTYFPGGLGGLVCCWVKQGGRETMYCGWARLPTLCHACAAARLPNLGAHSLLCMTIMGSQQHATSNGLQS